MTCQSLHSVSVLGLSIFHAHPFGSKQGYDTHSKMFGRISSSESV